MPRRHLSIERIEESQACDDGAEKLELGGALMRFEICIRWT